MWGSSTPDLSVFEKLLKNNSAAVNAWLEKQLEPHFRDIDGHFNEVETKLNTEREFIEHLKGQIQYLEEKNRFLEQRNQSLQDNLNRYLLSPQHSEEPVASLPR